MHVGYHAAGSSAAGGEPFMITVTLEMPIKPGKLAQFQSLIGPALKQTAAQPGFIAIRILRPVEGEDAAMFIEEWETAQDYKNYLAWRADGNDVPGMEECVGGAPVLKMWGEVIASE
jgi:quinol monooxygenase YgiN